MKKLPLTFLASIFASLAFATSLKVNAKYIDPVMEKNLVKVCEAIKSNSRAKLDVAIKNGHFNYRQIQKGLVCNGLDVLSFAQAHQADKTAGMIAARVNISLDTQFAKVKKSHKLSAQEQY